MEGLVQVAIRHAAEQSAIGLIEQDFVVAVDEIDDVIEIGLAYRVEQELVVTTVSRQPVTAVFAVEIVVVTAAKKACLRPCYPRN